MAQTLAANSVVEITMRGTYQGSSVLNVFHYYNTTNAIVANGDAELLAMISNFRLLVWNPGGGAGVKDRLVDSFTLDYIQAQQVAPTRQYYQYTAIGETGARAEPGIPSDTNITLSFRTARALQGTTGSKHFTGLSITDMSAAVWTNATILNWVSQGSNMRVTLAGGAITASWDPIVWSPRRSTDRALIVGGNVQQEVRVMRRRQFRLGI